MREIKFRAWHKHPSKGFVMSPVISIEFRPPISINTESGSFPSLTKGDDTIIKLMQFTGLLDRNGKEIYEGDIVISRKYETSQAKTVKWIARRSSCPGWNIATSSYNGKMNLEIIGNIYENPELINQTA